MKRREFLGTLGSLSILSSSTFTADCRQEAPPSTQEVGQQTWLLVDDQYILYRSGTKRFLHPLTRHPKNPLLRGLDRPWELALGWNSVYRNPVSGLYQLWYQAFAGDVARDKTRRCTVCYAESQDGIVWTKPNLGLYAFNDIKDTNIVLLANGGFSNRYGASVVFDPLGKDESRRYKMVYFDFSKDRQGHELPGLNVAFSPDGIHWKKYSGGTLLTVAYGDVDQPPYRGEPSQYWQLPLTMSDAMDVFYDPKSNAFVCYGKMWIDGPDGKMFWKHAMGRTQSSNFTHWSQPKLILTPDDLDPPYVEFHTSPVFFYNDCYFAALQILNRAVRGGVIDIELAVSRDGFRWERPFRQPFFLAKNSGNQFDSGSLFTNSTPVFLEDEIRFYYAAYSQGATGGDDNDFVSGATTSGIGLATMPRDRFAAIRPREKIGQVTFKPVNLKNFGAVSINGNANDGRIWCEVLDANGFRLRGFAREDATPIRGDSLRHKVQWKEKVIAQLPDGRHMLRVHLENAELFAVSLLNKV